MLKMIAKPLFLVMCAAMSFTAPMDICMAQDKQETLGQSVKEQIPFTLGYLTTTSHLLAFIAKEEGYFAEEGLDVELIPFASAGVPDSVRVMLPSFPAMTERSDFRTQVTPCTSRYPQAAAVRSPATSCTVFPTSRAISATWGVTMMFSV